jgi:hypothetical protein
LKKAENSERKKIFVMQNKKHQYNPTEIPPPGIKPGISIPVDPEDPVIPLEDPVIIPDEDPFENPPPFEIPEPGEGP